MLSFVSGFYTGGLWKPGKEWMLLVLALLWPHGHIYADEDLFLRGQVSLGISSYQLTLTGAGSGSPNASSLYPYLGTSLILVSGKGFIVASYSTSLAASHDWPVFEGDFQRNDIAVTGGYLLEGGWSLFAGYKFGSSEFYQGNLPGYHLDFDSYGPFVGTSKVVQTEGGASLSYRAALALMTGYVHDTIALDDFGKAIGVSLALSYSQPFSNDTGIKLRAFHQSYSFSGFNTVADAAEIIFGVETSYYVNF